MTECRRRISALLDRNAVPTPLLCALSSGGSDDLSHLGNISDTYDNIQDSNYVDIASSPDNVDYPSACIFREPSCVELPMQENPYVKLGSLSYNEPLLNIQEASSNAIAVCTRVLGDLSSRPTLPLYATCTWSRHFIKLAKPHLLSLRLSRVSTRKPFSVASPRMPPFCLLLQLKGPLLVAAQCRALQRRRLLADQSPISRPTPTRWQLHHSTLDAWCAAVALPEVTDSSF